MRLVVCKTNSQNNSVLFTVTLYLINIATTSGRVSTVMMFCVLVVLEERSLAVCCLDVDSYR